MDKLATVITLLWLLLFICLLIFNLDTLVSMRLNEWGDFLAGATAPVAFLWLIVGYRLQKNELIMNTEVLKSQQIELSNQVKELSKQNEILLGTQKASETMALAAKSANALKSFENINTRFSK